MTYYLIKDKTIQTKNIKSYKENELVIDCANEESVTKALKVLSVKLVEKCEIIKEQITNPKVKVVGNSRKWTIKSLRMTSIQEILANSAKNVKYCICTQIRKPSYKQ